MSVHTIDCLLGMILADSERTVHLPTCTGICHKRSLLGSHRTNEAVFFGIYVSVHAVVLPHRCRRAYSPVGCEPALA